MILLLTLAAAVNAAPNLEGLSRSASTRFENPAGAAPLHAGPVIPGDAVSGLPALPPAEALVSEAKIEPPAPAAPVLSEFAPRFASPIVSAIILAVFLAGSVAAYYAMSSPGTLPDLNCA